jgi:IstB-like ATP binding protein
MSKHKLDIDHTRERMLAFGLIHAADQLDPMLSEAVKRETAPHAFLEQLLEAEYQGREARRVRTALRLSNLPTGHTLADFDFAFQPAIERSRIETLATRVAMARSLGGRCRAHDRCDGVHAALAFRVTELHRPVGLSDWSGADRRRRFHRASVHAGYHGN